MKKVLPVSWFFLRSHTVVATLMVSCASSLLSAAHGSGPPLNKYGAPVLDAQGHRIKYDRKTLEAMSRTKGDSSNQPARTTQAPAPKDYLRTRTFELRNSRDEGGRTPAVTPTPRPQRTPPPRPTPQPTALPWQYAVFGAGIGLSNVVIGPMPSNGAPEIIIGGNSRKSDEFAPDDFWQSIRYNPATGNYDTIFVSPIYQPREFAPVVNISRIGLAHVTSASDLQIVVMLEDGRVYLYDFATKAVVGYLDINQVPANFGLRGLSLTDLDGDGLAELIVTNDVAGYTSLYVFNGSGQLLWQVPDAGGYDVIAGRMDNGASLKIATSSGKVIDATTHQVIWDYSNGFGPILRLAPLAGENYQQLISASGWEYIDSYDVGRQLRRWSIDVANDYIGAMDVADVDGDGVPEILAGEGQMGVAHVYDLNTQAEKWEVQTGLSGVNSIGAADVDRDGSAELLFATGYENTGPDYLYVTSTAGGHEIKWQSIDLVGPFLGPAIGDLDGDGQAELVICSLRSDADYDSGRILVFDLATLTLRAISAPVFDHFAGTGVHDLKLRDVDGGGRMEIVLAADYMGDGAIEIYRFDSDNSFTRIWANATRPFGSPFKFVEVADLDNNGTQKIIATDNAATDGSEGVYVYAYDYPSGAESWRSALLATYFSSADGLVVEDLDGDGRKEIVALVTGNLYTWDGPTRQLLNVRQRTGIEDILLSNRATPAGLVLGDESGVGHFLHWGNNSYTETFSRQLATNCVPEGYPPCMNGLNVTSDNSLWTGTGAVLNERAAPSYESVIWQSSQIGDRVGRFIATAQRNGGNCVFSSDQHAAVCFGSCAPGRPPTPTPNPLGTPRPRPTPPPRP